MATDTITFTGSDAAPPGTTISFTASTEHQDFFLGSTKINPDHSFSFSADVMDEPWVGFFLQDSLGNIDDVEVNRTVSNQGITATNTTTLDVPKPPSASDNDPTSAVLTKNQTIKPFAHATVTGDGTIQVTITQASGYAPSSNLTFSGTATQAQAFLDSFSAKALQNGPGQITATLSAPSGSTGGEGNAGGKVTTFSTFTFTGTAPGGSGLQAPTSGQIATLTNDTIKFYNDAQKGADTTGDATQLSNDLIGISIDKPTLAQLLSAALNKDAGGNAGTLANDLANVFFGSIKSDTQSQSPNLASDLTTMIKQTAAVGSTYATDIFNKQPPAQALAETIAQYHLNT